MDEGTVDGCRHCWLNSSLYSMVKSMRIANILYHECSADYRFEIRSRRRSMEIESHTVAVKQLCPWWAANCGMKNASSQLRHMRRWEWRMEGLLLSKELRQIKGSGRENIQFWWAELSPTTKEQRHTTINDKKQCTTLETNDTTPQYTIHDPSSCTDISRRNIFCPHLCGCLSVCGHTCQLKHLRRWEWRMEGLLSKELRQINGRWRENKEFCGQLNCLPWKNSPTWQSTTSSNVPHYRDKRHNTTIYYTFSIKLHWYKP
jgi:hypothetical protein